MRHIFHSTGLKSLPLEEEGTTVSFLHCALISSIDQLKNIGDIGLFCVCYFFIHMLIVLVCFNLILAYSFVLFSLTLSSTAVMLSKTQLGM